MALHDGDGESRVCPKQYRNTGMLFIRPTARMWFRPGRSGEPSRLKSGKPTTWKVIVPARYRMTSIVSAAG